MYTDINITQYMAMYSALVSYCTLTQSNSRTEENYSIKKEYGLVCLSYNTISVAGLHVKFLSFFFFMFSKGDKIIKRSSVVFNGIKQPILS